MRNRINTPKLIGIATTDATCFMFPVSKDTLEKDKRGTAFMKKKIYFK